MAVMQVRNIEQASLDSEALFALLGLWLVDEFGQIERVAGFRRAKGRWLILIETTDLSAMMERDEVWPAAVAVLAGRDVPDAEWSERLFLLALRFDEQPMVLCRHLADAVAVARARRYWHWPFEMSGSGPLWCRVERQSDRLRRLILKRRSRRLGIPALELPPDRQFFSPTHDVTPFVRKQDAEVSRFATSLWDRFGDRFRRSRERRLEEWCGGQPGVAYRHATRLHRAASVRPKPDREVTDGLGW